MANVEGQAGPVLFVIYHFPFVICHFQKCRFCREPEAPSLFLFAPAGTKCYREVVETKRRNLLGASKEDLAPLLEELGEPAYRARQIFAGIYRRRLQSWAQFTDLSRQLRQALEGQFSIEYPSLERTFVSKDGTRRYLFKVSPGQRIESVFIPEEKRDTFCISTQVGCAVECLFCVTGKLPIRRNLTAGEMVGQVLLLQQDRGTAATRLNIVIMGMGEPLHNYDNVMKALRVLTDKDGTSLSPRRITLSTSGVVPEIERLGREPVIPNLAVSLNATTDAVRDVLIPINRKWNIARLLQACRGFTLQRRRRITFEYVLIEGVNDTPEDARRLVRLLGGLEKKVNLIPLNSDPWIPLKTPGEERILAF